MALIEVLKGSGPRAVASLAAIALLVSCTDPAPAGRERVILGGETFWLEPALDDQTRLVGLGGRRHIEPDGGMLFVFPTSAPRSFVMRDCFTDIDIAYLDGAGRVVSTHEMTVEPPRRPDESQSDYEFRLKQYPSRYPTQIVVEVAPGTLRRLDVKPGDLVQLDAEGLKRRTK